MWFPSNNVVRRHMSAWGYCSHPARWQAAAYCVRKQLCCSHQRAKVCFPVFQEEITDVSSFGQREEN